MSFRPAQPARAALARGLAHVRRALLVLAFAAAGGLSPAAAGEPVFLPGSNWGLVAPPDFVVEEQPSLAFVHPAGATIMVVTMTQPVDPSRFAAVGSFVGRPGSRGRVEATGATEVGGLPGYVVRMRALDVAADTISLFVQGRTTGFLTATIFDQARPLVTDDAVMAALMTAVERELSPAEQLSALPVEFAELLGLRIVVTTHNGVVLTDGPQDEGRLGPGQHFVSVVAFPPVAAGGYRLADDLGAFASHIEGSFRTSRVTASRVLEGAEAAISRSNSRSTRTTFRASGRPGPS